MKKTLITLIFIVVSNILFAQKTATTDWIKHGCFKGISYKIQNHGYRKDWDAAGWGVIVKNNYNNPVQIVYKLTVGGIEMSGNNTVTNFLAPGESYTNDAGTLKALLFKTTSTSYVFTIISLCFNEKEGCYKSGYATCDNGSPNQPQASKNNSNSQNTNGGNNSNSSSQSSMQDLLNKWNELCQKSSTAQNPTVRSANGRSCLSAAQNYEDNDANRRMIAAKIKDLETALATDNDYESKQDAAKKAEEERLQAQSKVLVQKTTDFTNLINDGDVELNNKNYDAAISKYNQAKNLYTGSLAPQEEAYAKDAIPLANARIAAAEKAKADAARVVRTDEKRKVEQQQNDATIAAAASFAGVMALINDAYSPGKFAAKFQVGLGYGSTGITANSTNKQQSLVKSSNQFQFRLGFKLGFANNKGISFQLNPLVDLGVNALQTGIDGASTAYGGTGTLFFAKKATSKIKLFAEGGYLSTSGTYNYDQAVAEGANSTSDNVETSTYKYSTIKYGGGIMFNLIDDGKETFIKPGLFFEKPSFLQKNIKPVMVGNLQVNIVSFIILDVSYSKNYFVSGALAYPSNFTPENKNFWSVKLIRQGKLK